MKEMVWDLSLGKINGEEKLLIDLLQSTYDFNCANSNL